jgi:pimeloyl-ACP methyl ester carboxylesterase
LIKLLDLALVSLVFLVLCIPTATAQNSIEGHWEGVMARDGANLPVSFDFIKQGGTIKASFNSPTQRALGIPLQKFAYADSKVRFELVGDATTIVFDGEVAADDLHGQFQEGDARGTFSFKRVRARPPASKSEDVSFHNGGITLSGTLLRPLTAGPSPAVVFVHGSGPEGRYASHFLAEYFARFGIASLIYDKRGVGKSTGDWKQSDFTDLARDALAGIAFLKTRKEIDARMIGVYGHSQGGMIAPLISSLSKDVAFVIGGAGSAVPLYQAEEHSITSQIRAQGIAGTELADAKVFIKLLVNVLRTGEGWDEFNAASAKARTRTWYPMLHVPAKDDWFWPFFRKIADYNSADYWQHVNVPALVLYGERDILVPVEQSIASIDRALNKAGNQDYTIVVLPRASHAFNVEPQPGQPFEWWHMAPGFPDLLTAWIGQRTMKMKQR